MKKTFAKLISFLLIIFGIYHIVLSLVAIFIIYPQTLGSQKLVPFDLQESLVEKAIIIYISTAIDGLYGFSLLVKPAEKIKTVHLLAGMIIFVFSFFFVTRTRLTNDPLFLLLSAIFNPNGNF